ncbi:MAG: RIP metalloprotease RseP [Oscillatoriales cyanobacterium SM2_2_1]|nr:RIP metalloprotease RseP [Oscillatoriales cyanobacterium SM2_2_1]
MSFLPSIAILALLVFIHELGHFAAARWQGIHVDRFSIGFGPVLWRYQGSQTEYALRLIPLGGYVGFPDENPHSVIPADDPNLMGNRPIRDRAIVISAGVIANLLLAYAALLVMVVSVGVGTVDQPGVKILSLITPDAPAARAGLLAGDVVRSADGQALPQDLEVLDRFQRLVASHANELLLLEVERSTPTDTQTLTISVTPQGELGKGKIGVRLDYNGRPYRQPIREPIAALGQASHEFRRLLMATLNGFRQLATNFAATAQQIAGPVAIVAMGSELARSDAASLFDFTAVISINLAILNILPLPALDGGQLLFLLIEALRGGKPLPSAWQENVMQGGLVLLLGLGVVLIFRDSFNLWQTSIQ